MNCNIKQINKVEIKDRINNALFEFLNAKELADVSFPHPENKGSTNHRVRALLKAKLRAASLMNDLDISRLADDAYIHFTQNPTNSPCPVTHYAIMLGDAYENALGDMWVYAVYIRNPLFDHKNDSQVPRNSYGWELTF